MGIVIKLYVAIYKGWCLWCDYKSLILSWLNQGSKRPSVSGFKRAKVAIGKKKNMDQNIATK